MPTLGVVAGKDMFLYIQQAGVFILVGCATNSTLSVNADMLQAACKSSAGWNEGKPSQKSWEVQLEGIYKIYDSTEEASNVSAIELFDAIVASTKLSLKFGTSQTGDVQLSGDAFVTSWELTGEVEGISTYSATLSGTGPISKVTVAA